jgi:transposase
LARLRDIVFFHHQGFSNEQISKKTGFDENTVKRVVEEEKASQDRRWRQGYISKLPKGGKRK